MKTGSAAVLLVALLLAPTAAAGDEPLVWLRLGAGSEEASASVVDHADAILDRGARHGAPLESGDDGLTVAAADRRTSVAPPRVRSVSVHAGYLYPILPDGTTVPAAVDRGLLTLEAGVGGERETLTLRTERPASGADAAAAAPSVSTAAGTPYSGGADVSPYRPALSSPAPGRTVGSAPTPGETVTPRPVERDGGGSTVSPSAVALRPVDDDRAAVAAAAGALALGALLALWPLYHRLRGARTLESTTRRAIYDAVCERPGIGVQDVATRVGLAYSTTSYHMERLVEAGMLVSSTEGSRVRYFKNGGFNESHRKIAAVLGSREAMRVLDLIRQNPGTYRAALADAMNVTTTTVNWHLRRLADAGLVREERRGRSAHLFAVEDRVPTNLRALVDGAPATA